MPSEQVTIDSTLIAATNVQVILDDSTNGIELVSHDYPDPGPVYTGASSADTEGSVPVQNQYQDRIITVVARCFGSSNMRARVKTLQQKIGKLNREQGTVTRTLSDGTLIHFDVKSAKLQVPADWQFLHQTSVMVTLEFVCSPVGRGAEITVAAQTESTLPCNVYTVTGIKGDQPALGRLVITEAQGADQWHVAYGLESRYYGGTATAYSLFLEAESRLLYAGVAGTAVTGASGGTIALGTATGSYRALLATTSSGTAYLAHTGTYRVFARAYCPANAGTVSFALQWGVGDLRVPTTNDTVEYPPTYASTFRHLDLGLVQIPPVIKGTQRWEGRVLGKSSTVGDRIGIDCLYLFPVSEGYAEASGVVGDVAPSQYVARDEFDQSAGTLSGKTLPVGGTWSGAGDTDDFSVETTGHTLERTATSDTPGTGRFAIAGTTSISDVTASVDVKISSLGYPPASGVFLGGLLLRYTDTSNYVIAVIKGSNYPAVAFRLALIKVVGGSQTTINEVLFSLTGSTFYTVSASLIGGTYSATVANTGGGTLATISGSDSVLDSGATLGTGKVGIYDEWRQSGANTRNYDNLVVYGQSGDAAIYASQQLEIHHNAAIRKDSTGSYWQPVSSYQGDYLRIPPAGAEARSARFIVKASRHVPTTGVDTAIDDLTVQLYYSPRWLTVPEA